MPLSNIIAHFPRLITRSGFSFIPGIFYGTAMTSTSTPAIHSFSTWTRIAENYSVQQHYRRFRTRQPTLGRLEKRWETTQATADHVWKLYDSTHPMVNFKFVLRDKTEVPVKAPIGVSLLTVAQHYDLPVEGACEASLACSTCHVIMDDKTFSKLPEASEREDDLLDMAPHLTDTSRLSCQIQVTSDLEGAVVTLPPSTLNFYVDGYVAKAH